MATFSDVIASRFKQVFRTIEPGISLFSGSYLMYLGIKKRNFPLGFSGSYLLFHGGFKLAKANEIHATEAFETGQKKIEAVATIAVNKSKADSYNAWRKFESIPKFMNHVSRVTMIDEKTMEWEIKVPGEDEPIIWINRITRASPFRKISWKSTDQSLLDCQGTIIFKKIDQDKTEVKSSLVYKAKSKSVTNSIENLLSPIFEKMLENDLKNFKYYLESKTDL
jgi:uncharacterized membrane protein